MPLRVAFHTLGCKLNQLETESIADAFAKAGAIVLSHAEDEPEDDLNPERPGRGAAADLVVINTCTVTGKAEQKARRLVRLALATDPRAVVLVTGCYAEVDPEAVAALGERTLVLPGGSKEELLAIPALVAGLGGDELLASLRAALSGGASGGVHGGRFGYNPGSFAFHSRPALKVQDGCDNACAFCRVHLARGPSSSLPIREAVARARALEAAGRSEIVLAGVNLSQYRDGELGFPALLRHLVEGTERISFRISSYEPDKVDAEFLEAFALPRVRPHAHLALQSGADPVLAAMGRRYGRDDAAAAVRGLRAAKGDPFIAVDLIAGFPGETEDDAEATLELARECAFAWIHAFRFSPRPGTKAAAMRDRVPERVAGDRVRALLGLGASGRAEYIRRWRGRELLAVLEEGGVATSENYLKLAIDDLPANLRKGDELKCCIMEGGDVTVEVGIDARARFIVRG
jgi:threonylcarbamoyladenosine tRNA methylthiotransferase MtaB